LWVGDHLALCGLGVVGSVGGLCWGAARCVRKRKRYEMLVTEGMSKRDDEVA